MAVHPQHEDVWSRATTVGGYATDEVRSVLQKSIRRGWVEEAVLAAYELYESGPESEDMLWRRLEIIATEDVGFGLIDAPAIIEALNAQRLRIPPTPDRWIFAVHAVRLLATAAKDRTSTDLAIWAREVVRRGEREARGPGLAGRLPHPPGCGHGPRPRPLDVRGRQPTGQPVGGVGDQMGRLCPQGHTGGRMSAGGERGTGAGRPG